MAFLLLTPIKKRNQTVQNLAVFLDGCVETSILEGQVETLETNHLQYITPNLFLFKLSEKVSYYSTPIFEYCGY